MKSELREIWLSGGRDSVNKAFNGMLAKYSDKYPAAMKKLTKGAKNCSPSTIFRLRTGLQ
ncbi:hypothetical protein EWM60_15470 [Candidatus Erwinia dacicola]|nr:hypothetical protein [Candidatus Erwinia dacicola]